jgi:hypothetical protein
MLSRRFPTKSDDDGMTLVELASAMVITMVVGTMIVTFMISTARNTRWSDGANEQSAAARSAIDSWSMLLRLAVDPVGRAQPGSARLIDVFENSVRFCAALDSKGDDPMADALPIGVRLGIEDDQLVERRWRTCPSMLAGDPVVVRRVVADGVGLVGDGTWLFAPLSADDMPVEVGGDLIVSSLVDGDTPIRVTDPDGYERILQTVGLQLAFRTIPDPRRPSDAATYSTVISLTAGA